MSLVSLPVFLCARLYIPRSLSLALSLPQSLSFLTSLVSLPYSLSPLYIPQSLSSPLSLYSLYLPQDSHFSISFLYTSLVSPCPLSSLRLYLTQSLSLSLSLSRARTRAGRSVVPLSLPYKLSSFSSTFLSPLSPHILVVILSLNIFIFLIFFMIRGKGTPKRSLSQYIISQPLFDPR